MENLWIWSSCTMFTVLVMCLASYKSTHSIFMVEGVKLFGRYVCRLCSKCCGHIPVLSWYIDETAEAVTAGCPCL